MDMTDCGCNYGMNRDISCSEKRCRSISPLPCTTAVAMAYIPFQQWNEVYCAEKALWAGTIFPCLNLPFAGCQK